MKGISFMHSDGAGVLRIFGLPFGWAGSKRSGVWWVGVWRWRLIVRAPWNEPLFSERYGLTKYLRLFGWRITSRRVP